MKNGLEYIGTVFSCAFFVCAFHLLYALLRFNLNDVVQRRTMQREARVPCVNRVCPVFPLICYAGRSDQSTGQFA